MGVVKIRNLNMICNNIKSKDGRKWQEIQLTNSWNMVSKLLIV